MRRKLLSALTSLPAFAVGILAFAGWTLLSTESTVDYPATPVNLEHALASLADLDEPPRFNDSVDYGRTLKTKLLLPGDFHDEEVPYRTGQRWQGLFLIGGEYELRSTRLIIERTQQDGRFRKSVSAATRGNPLFFLKGENLSEGPIETTFDLEDREDFEIDRCDSLKSSFRIKGMYWRLCIANAPYGHPEKGSSLELRGPGGSHVLRSLPNGCDDCSWRLIWAGDLDQDTSLDLLIDVTDHYNVTRPTLFLSSKDYAVAATFRGVGC